MENKKKKHIERIKIDFEQKFITGVAVVIGTGFS